MKGQRGIPTYCQMNRWTDGRTDIQSDRHEIRRHRQTDGKTDRQTANRHTGRQKNRQIKRGTDIPTHRQTNVTYTNFSKTGVIKTNVTGTNVSETNVTRVDVTETNYEELTTCRRSKCHLEINRENANLGNHVINNI